MLIKTTYDISLDFQDFFVTFRSLSSSHELHAGPSKTTMGSPNAVGNPQPPRSQPWKQRHTLMHSLKVTYLSAAAQLRLPQQSRRLQAHHKRDTVQLYSRDDTIESFWVQDKLATAVAKGWRPERRMVRGGQHTTIEPPFTVPPPPLPTSLNIHNLPPQLSPFLYERESPAPS